MLCCLFLCLLFNHGTIHAPPQCHPHHFTLTKIPSYISRAPAARLDSPQFPMTKLHGSADLKSNIMEVCGCKAVDVILGVVVLFKWTFAKVDRLTGNVAFFL